MALGLKIDFKQQIQAKFLIEGIWEFPDSWIFDFIPKKYKSNLVAS